jgi:hypothetical protein
MAGLTSAIADVAPPAYGWDLSCEGSYAEHGNPRIPAPVTGQATREGRCWGAGVGGWKKRMLLCNGVDRAIWPDRKRC